MSKVNTRYLITETPWKCILKFAIPLFLGTFVQQIYNISDSAIAGHFIGAEALAAVGTNSPIAQMTISLFMGTSIGANVLISQNYGAGNKEAILKIVDTFLIMIYALSLIFVVSFFLLANVVHKNILGTPADILAPSVLYMRITLIGIIGVFGYNGIAACLRALGDSQTSLILLIISNVVNILLSLLFVVYFDLSVMGLAIATATSQVLSFVIGIIYVNTKNKIIKIHFLHSQFEFSVLRDIIKVGLPGGIQGSCVSIGAFAIQSLVNTFGVATIAGFNTATKIEFLIVAGANNFGQALSVFLAQNVGANRYDRVKIGVPSAILMGAILVATMSTIVFIFSEKLIILFTTDPLVIQEGTTYLRAVSPLYIGAVVLFVLANGIRGTGATFVPMCITALGHLGLRVPLAYILVHIFHSPLGIWYAIPTAWTITAGITWLYYKSDRWKKHVRVKQPKRHA